MPELAQRMRHANPSTIMVISEKASRLRAQGHDIINFSIGVPHFLPGSHVYQAVREWLTNDSGRYGSNCGDDLLINAFIAHMKRVGLEAYGRNNCAMGIGAKHILGSVVEALIDDGDEIACPTPCWPSYLDIAGLFGARVKRLPCPPEQNYKVTPQQLDNALTSKPKIFLFNNPCNPTGMVYTQGEIAALADVLVTHPDTWVVTDDIYHRMVFDAVGYHNFIHARPELQERVAFVDSLSKTYGMPGWRVGMMAGPEAADRLLAVSEAP